MKQFNNRTSILARNILFLFFTVYFLFGCQTLRLMNQGEVQFQQEVVTIPIDFSLKIPIIEVEINGEIHNFILDTGAPTVISTRLFQELELQEISTKTVTDSQKKSQAQKFTSIPKMSIGNVIFNDIGAVVIDFELLEFSCYNIEGIIGANQMAKAYWLFNYQENFVKISNDISHFNITIEEEIPFEVKPQKSPMIALTLLDEKATYFTFDTGFNGRLSIVKQENYFQNLDETKYIESHGFSSKGIYGMSDSTVNFIFKVDKFNLDEMIFIDEIFNTGNSNLIGNEFLENFIFIIDWKKNKILLKQLSIEIPSQNSFGFSYTFIDQKAIVTNIIKSANNPIKIHDQILEINGISLENLSEEEVCNYLINKIEKSLDEITLKVKREEKNLEVTVKRIKYL